MTLAEAVEIVRRRHTPDSGPRRKWDDPDHYSSHGREVCTVLDALDAALAERDDALAREQGLVDIIAKLGATVVERDALREDVSRLEGEKIVVVGKWAAAEARALAAETGWNMANRDAAAVVLHLEEKLAEAEARAERAEAFVRAYLGLDGNEDVDDHALNVRARALLAPEAQRPAKEGPDAP